MTGLMKCEVIGNATLYLGDCLEWFGSVPECLRVNAIITDPPYSDEAHAAGRRVLSRGQAFGRTRAVDKAALPFPPLTPEMRFAVAEWAAKHCTGWLLAFCQAEAVADWRYDIAAAGARWIRAQIWVKLDSSPQLSGDRPAQGYESIATAWFGAGRSRWNGGGKRGVYTFTKHDPEYGHGGKQNEHPTKKPLALMNELVSLFSHPGQTVLDPFMGSGTTGVASVTQGRKFIGIERDTSYFETACDRIEMAQKQVRMFS